MTGRKIIHVDCDCFFAAVEMRDNPALRGRPLAVGGSPTGRGVVATCNYEAREFGIHSAMPMAHALRRCPNLTIVRGRMAVYREEAQKVRAIFHRYTDLVEPLSLDEAYLDVSACTAHRGSATRIATAIRDAIRREVGITASAGIAPNKFIAKVASDWQKPDNQTVVAPDDVDAFVAALPVAKIPGVGPATAKRLHARGFHTCADLRPFSRADLATELGRLGNRLYDLARGVDHREVVTSRRRKSLSVERTFSTDLPDLASCRATLADLQDELERRLANVDASYRIRGLFVKVRFSDFTTTTAENAGLEVEPDAFVELLKTAWDRGQQPVRLLGCGVRFNDVEEGWEQLPLID